MLFTSHLFMFVALPAFCLLVFGARRLGGKTAGIAAMIAASLVFYFYNGQAQLHVLVCSILINQLLIRAMLAVSGDRAKNLITGTAVVTNLLALAYYKYWMFLVTQYESIRFVLEKNAPYEAWWAISKLYHSLYPWGYAGESIVLPLAISFFTFQQIAYIVDLRVGRVPEHSFLNYVFCVTFFPHLIAGPIVNYRDLLPQLKRRRILSARGLSLGTGLAVFAIGLAKKTILADTLGETANQIFDSTLPGGKLTWAGAWLGALAYTFQIYFDFSGYSDMALGLARMFGVKLPVNFASPYKSKSIIEFWQRWHISLSTWFRTYVYMYLPMGGPRIGPFQLPPWNLIATFVLCGVWHGAGWTFLIWGLLHGLFLTFNHQWRDRARRTPWLKTAMRPWLAHALTFLTVVLLWVIFRATSLELAVAMIAKMFSPSLADAADTLTASKVAVLATAAVIAFTMPSTQEIFRRYFIGIEPKTLPRPAPSRIAWRASFSWSLVLSAVAGVACFYETDFPKFLYWNF